MDQEIKEIKIGDRIIRLGEDSVPITPAEKKVEPEKLVRYLEQELSKGKIFPDPEKDDE